MTKITRGARRHLLALYTHGVSCTLTRHNRLHWPAVRARQSLKKLERELRKGVPLLAVSRGPNVYEQILAAAHHDIAVAVLGKVSP